MYAIIQDGAHQFQVEPGQELDIDYRDLSAGDEVKFDRVLAYRDDAGLKIGRPTLESATVTAKVVSAVQGPKLVVQKFRRRRTSAAAPATGRFSPAWSSTRSKSADAASGLPISLRERVGWGNRLPLLSAVTVRTGFITVSCLTLKSLFSGRTRRPSLLVLPDSRPPPLVYPI